MLGVPTQKPEALFMKNMRSTLSHFLSTKRIARWAILLMLIAWLFANPPQAYRDYAPLFDFIEYWSAAKAFVNGNSPYSVSTLLEIQKQVGWTEPDPLMMWNPPWVLPILAPLSLIPFWTARALWFLFNGVLTILAVDWFWIAYGGSQKRRWMSWVGALFFLPFLQSMLLGQISPLVLTGIWGFVCALSKRRLFHAGIFSFLISIKPHVLYLFWIFLALWILKNKKWNVLWGFLISLLIMSTITFVINSHAFIEYVTTIRTTAGPQIWETPTWGVALGLICPEHARWLRFTPSLLGLILSLLVWRRWHSNFRWENQLPAILQLSVITSSFSWSIDWIVLLPIAIYIIFRFQQSPWKHIWMAAVLLIMQPLLILTLFKFQSNFYAIWFPPALWCLFYIAARADSFYQSSADFCDYDTP
ncbi:MAG: DUF2029 domain-containing protein [Acidobacteria bacterium]|nr:DUF2029 domain-containing protein [Acidobacteriota bacterium]